MWAVRHAYERRADNYVQLHGKYNFGPGGEPHQVMETLAGRGFVTEEAYDGLTIGLDQHTHGEMDNVLHAFVEAIVENKNRRLSPVWMDAYQGILDAYLGAMPEEFEFEGTTYTPKEFAEKVMKLNPDEYVEITSYMDHPYYRNYLLKIPDNWDYEMYYNVPMVDLTNIMDFALERGYTIAWAADVSCKGFNHKKGLALIPEKDWDDMSKGEQDSVFIAPVKQKEITPELRLEAYNNYTTTDDHSMHIIGYAEDQDGNRWYKVKNSWAGDSNDFGGYFYASKSYIQLRTIAIYVSKDVMPQGIN
jgi:bleomycin hydrolase